MGQWVKPRISQSKRNGKENFNNYICSMRGSTGDIADRSHLE